MSVFNGELGDRKAVIRDADILTMEDGPVLRHGDLYFAKGKILKISEYAPGEAPSDTCASYTDAELIDGQGCVVMPGFIDSHVHFDDSYMGDFFLACGITSVRNMRGLEGHARWRDEILAGKRRGPYIYSSGPVYDGEDPTIPDNDNWILHTETDVEEAIAFTKGHGYLWMKTYPSIEPDLYRYLLKRCREENLPVCGHMTKKMDHKELADGGYVCCEHTSSLPSDPETIQYLAESGMWFCPTHVVCETLPEYVWNGKRLDSVPHFKDLPEFVQKDWEEQNQVIVENYRKLNVHPDFQTIIDRATTFLKYSKRVMAGTDCAYPGVVPGFSLAQELENLVNVYGMSIYEALCAATCNPAGHTGIGEKKGKLKPGMDSDLVVLQGNPLADIGNVRFVQRVVQGNFTWDKEALQQFLAADSKLKKEEEEKLL